VSGEGKGVVMVNACLLLHVCEVLRCWSVGKGALECGGVEVGGVLFGRCSEECV
jgi:hypothetical protein